MIIKEQENFMAGVQHALTLPIRARCAELTVLLDRGNLVELHSFYPVLIENIFGPQGTLSWGLRTTTENDQEDFRQLQHFLSPCGPIFKLIYTLLKDPNIRYEFSLTYLPLKIKQFLENSHGHPFYSELLHSNSQTKQVSLMLNAFDYYMFHFAYHLINPWQQRGGSAIKSWNTVYYVICCDYIIHFLPTDPSVTIQPVIYYNGKNPIQAAKMFLSDKPQCSGLINAKKEAKDEGITSNLDFHHPRNDIWRSETVLTVFTDMWLHNNQIMDNTSHFNNLNNLNTLNQSYNSHLLQHNELPTGEYMRIVRVLVKQLHSFHASARADDTHLGELKKMSISMIQGKFYIFLRNLIHRWPLDGSFRLVLELWLTYIQPWRYPPNNLIKQINKKDINPDVEDISLASQNEVDTDYIPFIAENLLTYTVIFQQLLPRFGRVDLVSPKMSLMLYRIAKVFDQPNLPRFIREIEQCVENNNSPTHNYNWGNNLPPLSPTSNWSTNTSLQKNITASDSFQSKTTLHNGTYLLSRPITEKRWSAVVKQKMLELEGPNFCYKPLFANPPAPEVFDLIKQIRKSIRHSEQILQTQEKEEHERYSGFWGHIKYFFLGTDTNDEFTLKERQKVPLYLQVSLQNLIDMFNVNNEMIERDYEPLNLSATSVNTTNDFKFLTPERIRARVKNIRYEGDPDLKPIQSNENAFLVRILYQIACKINEAYGPTFYQLYHRTSFVGKLSREILCPPMTIYKYDKSTPGSPRLSSTLPPRLSFRFLANYSFLGYLFFGGFVAYLLGYRIEVYFAFLIVMFVFYKSCRALRSMGTPVRHNYPTQGFGNISFNDSF